MNDKIYMPTKGPESWRDFLAKPETQWETGFSAKSLAYCWEENNGFPNDFNKVLLSSDLELEILLAIPEYKVNLNTSKAPSQNDLFVLGRNADGLVVIMIEGKVSEPFDQLVKDWHDNESKISRFNYLVDKLEIKLSIYESYNLRYQLFHRTVSSIIVAEKFAAKKAFMIVHSFSPSNAWFTDYANFVNVLNPDINPKINEIYKCKTLDTGIELYVGWVKGDEKYLRK